MGLGVDEYLVLSDKCYLDLEHGDVIKNELRISLSKREALLIECLGRNLGHPVSKLKLVRYVWGSGGMPFENSLYQYVHRIRSVLEENIHHPVFLLSIKGYGYMLQPKHDSPRQTESAVIQEGKSRI